MTIHWIRTIAPLAILVAAALPGGLHNQIDARPERAAATPARLVRAEVSWDGQVMLRASTSDDGKPDADAVWAYLDRLRFSATEAFEELLADSDGLAFVFETKPKARDVIVKIAYGGRSELWKLAVRGVETEHGVRWELDGERLSDVGSLRWIRREWAGRSLR